MDSGWVYIAWSAKAGMYKIGMTMGDVDERIKKQRHAMGNRFNEDIDIELVYKVEVLGGEPVVKMVEEALHTVCHKFCGAQDESYSITLGDWFTLPKELVDQMISGLDRPLVARDAGMMHTIIAATWLDAQGTLVVVAAMLKEHGRMLEAQC